MLRLALIILAKRHGPRWCQNNIIKTILKPLIEKEDVPEKTKAFCISVLGALLKPYPVDMKVHCEITINELFDMLKGNRKYLFIWLHQGLIRHSITIYNRKKS